MTQKGFSFDQSRCTGCQACAVSCKSTNQLDPGPVKYLRVYQYEKGSFPNVRLHFQWMPCYHCENPVCTDVCEFDAIFKEDEHGAVLINEDKCVGCRLCAEACPYGAITFQENRDYVNSSFDVWSKVECSQACPVHINVPRYVGLVGEGRMSEAVAVVREKLPLPSVCGYVCSHPCETACNRGKVDSPVSIRALKRYAEEHDTGLWKENSKVAPSTGKRVAVVGSGPAGLTAAYYTAKQGHAVTIFEALPELGGLMRYGVPEFRLPRKDLDRDIDEIRNIGVEMKTNAKVESIEKLIGENFDAVLVSVGTSQGQKLPVPGSDMEGVMNSLDFLREVTLGNPVRTGNQVVVLGGGSVAFDCARTARRLGAADVTVACLEAKGRMLAMPEDITWGVEEDIKIVNSVTFTRIVGNGRATGVECLDVESFSFDKSGGARVKVVEGSQRMLAADTVIFAVGQKPDLGLVDGVGGINKARKYLVETDAGLHTGKAGVFAAGDAVDGSSTIIEAVASGRQAAISIDKYLGGQGNIDEVLAPVRKMNQFAEPADLQRQRIFPPDLGVNQRCNNFAEVELSLSDQAAVNEARRCLSCYPVEAKKCNMCTDRIEQGELPACVTACPTRALDFGHLSEMVDKYGDNRDLEDLPSRSITEPGIVFVPMRKKHNVIPYDAEKAVRLFEQRDLQSKNDEPATGVKEIPEGMVGRGKLVIKHESTEELLFSTINDEG